MYIALFSGFTFHYEMFGYILHFCKSGGHKLTIYCNQNMSNGFIECYNNIFNNTYDNIVLYKDFTLFENEKNIYDAIFLTTDDDPMFNKNDSNIINKTICIDHYYKIRSPIFNKRIATRPFSDEYYRDWALPLYPILNVDEKNKYMNSFNTNTNTHITLLGRKVSYDSSVFNRLRTNTNNKIIVHAIARTMSREKFKGINNEIDLRLYSNISAAKIFDILYISNYIITDVGGSDIEHIEKFMSGAIPLFFSTLTPLIISTRTNKYYKFKNVIEFDLDSNEEIHLKNIDLNLLSQERDELIQKNKELFDKYLKKIESEL